MSLIQKPEAVTCVLMASVATFFWHSTAVAQDAPDNINLGTIVVEVEAATEDGTVPKSSSVATRSDLPLERTPQTVSVVTNQQIETRQVQNPTEALRYNAGVNSEAYGADPRSDWIRVRGFHAYEYLDGLKLARGQYAWPRLDPYFLERYEVLRGPAGSLYGQNPPGGLVNMVSKRPTEEEVRQVGLRFGDPTHIGLFGDFGGKLSEDGRLTYRLTGNMRQGDTFVDHEEDQYGALSGALTWNISDATALTFSARRIEDDSGSVQFLPISGVYGPNPNGELPRNLNTGEPDFDEYTKEQSYLGYDLRHEFANGAVLSHKLGWSHVLYDQNLVRGFGVLDASGTMLDRNAITIHDDTEALSTDTNVKFDLSTGAVDHEILVGIDHRNQTSDYNLRAGLADPLNIYDPVYGGVVVPNLFTIAAAETELKQTGIYVQDTMTTGNWTFLMSARNDWYELEELSSSTVNDGDALTWRLGAVYSFDNGLSVYGSHATSFDPLTGTDANTGNPLVPTESVQTEIGLKYAPAGRNMLITLSAFDLTQENTVVSAAAGLGSTQIGESQVRGIELDARAELDNGLTLGATYAWMDSEVTVGDAAIQGNRLPFVADHQASLYASYQFDGNLDWLNIGGGLRYSDDFFSDTSNSIETGGYLLADLNASIDLSDWAATEKARLDLSIANVTDEKFIASCGDGSCYWGAGRTIRGALVFDF